MTETDDADRAARAGQRGDEPAHEAGADAPADSAADPPADSQAAQSRTAGPSAVDPAADPATGSVVPLSRLRALLATPRGRQRVDALLAAPDPTAAVASLPVIELYQLFREVGLADTMELVALATPAQLRGCMDIDGWDRDRVQLDGLKPWLAALVDTGFEKLGEVWAALDPELTALILARSARVHDLTLDEHPADPDHNPVLLTPDTFFALEVTDGDADTAALVLRLIDDLYRADPGGALARHALMAARSEPVSELEEMSYRWRSGRMADLGYADYYEALEVFRPLDLGSVAIGEGTQDRVGPAPEDDVAVAPGRLPIPVAEKVVGRSFLSRALDRVRDPAPASAGAPTTSTASAATVTASATTTEHERLAAALVVLVNKVLAAARVSPGQPGAIELGAEHATATLALGLELIARGDEDRAAEALRTVSMTRLHRLGHSATLPLARLARALAPRAAIAGDADAIVLAALTGRRPLYPVLLDDDADAADTAAAASREAPRDGVRPFESRADLRRAAAALTRLALRVAIADTIGVDLLAAAGQPEPRPALDDYIRTALVRAAAGGALEPAPLSVAELAAATSGVGAAFAGGQIAPEARARAGRALLAALDRDTAASGAEHLPALLARWMADIEAAIGGAAGGDAPRRLDPRFVGGLILAGARA